LGSGGKSIFEDYRRMTFFRPSLTLLGLLALTAGYGCGQNSDRNGTSRTINVSSGGRIKTLDPALASDLASRDMVAAFYDRLLQYDYSARPYKLVPSMLESMPQVSKNGKVYTFKLRDDLYFKDDPCFQKQGEAARKVTSHDVVFSFLRIADARMYSPVFWMFRGKIVGINSFRYASGDAEKGDYTLYDKGIHGLKVIDERTFKIILNKPDPRFLYALAIPTTSVISRQAVKFYGNRFAESPVGSGPFYLKNWIRDYQVVLERNPEYRLEYYKDAENPADRTRPLPLAERIVCSMIKQPVSGWLLFLQGGLDMSSVNKDNFQSVVGVGGALSSALADRGIKLERVPEFEIRYIGFNFTDPVLGKNIALRRAISLAYNVDDLVMHFNQQIVPVHGPVPPGVAGHDPEFRNPWSKYDLERARKLMVEAGYPGGVNSKTGKALKLTFDLSGTSSAHRQLAEMMVRDMARIGIKIVPSLNSRPRFFQKIRKGSFQLFRLSWIGDYPDAENFLQLFYGPNAGSCNRVFYRDPKFDIMYKQIIPLADTPERTKLYREMSRYIAGQCPWIFESCPVSYRLLHKWVQNYRPHDFAFGRWKYLTVDPKMRKTLIKGFKPFDFDDLQPPAEQKKKSVQPQATLKNKKK
jgi:peptide/nickel transport system substrate-binding protein